MSFVGEEVINAIELFEFSEIPIMSILPIIPEFDANEEQWDIERFKLL